MLKLTVTRCWFTEKSTSGVLDIEGVFIAYTLEPPAFAVNAPSLLLPVGTYRLALLPSARFETYTPHVLDVPGRTAIEIHPGNGPEDTEGCTLVGITRGQDFVGNSREAFNELLERLDPEQDMEIEYAEQRAVSA